MYKERIGEGKLTTEMLILQSEFLTRPEKKDFEMTLMQIRYWKEFDPVERKFL